MSVSWRWFGPTTQLPANMHNRCGESALHSVPWPLAAIQKHQALIKQATPSLNALKWSVVESIPVHEDIKLAKSGHQIYIDNWISAMENLAQCGLKTICYNFMPVIDWTRTELSYQLPSFTL